METRHKEEETKEAIEIKWIDINGAQVVDVTPDHHRELALVDLEVLNKLTKLLPIALIFMKLRERS